jgi:hypothetical protein
MRSGGFLEVVVNPPEVIEASRQVLLAAWAQRDASPETVLATLSLAVSNVLAQIDWPAANISADEAIALMAVDIRRSLTFEGEYGTVGHA